MYDSIIIRIKIITLGLERLLPGSSKVDSPLSFPIKVKLEKTMTCSGKRELL